MLILHQEVSKLGRQKPHESGIMVRIVSQEILLRKGKIKTGIKNRLGIAE
jgi:hypothetical protein